MSELEQQSYQFVFEEEPNVVISFDDNDVITSIIGVRTNGSKVDNTDPKNPQSRKPITLTVRDVPTVMRLRQLGFKKGEKSIPPKTEKVQRFIKVVEAYVDIATTEGKWGDPLVGDEVWQKKDLGNYNNIVKFLWIADQVGFYSLADKKRKEYEIRETKKEQKQSHEIELSSKFLK